MVIHNADNNLWPKRFKDLYKLRRRYPLTFMLVNCGNGYTHWCMGGYKYDEIMICNADMNPELKRLCKHENLLLSVRTFNFIFPKAFFVPYNDCKIIG